MAVDTKAPGQAPPDLPSLLLDGRICYIGMSVRLAAGSSVAGCIMLGAPALLCSRSCCCAAGFHVHVAACCCAANTWVLLWLLLLLSLLPLLPVHSRSRTCGRSSRPAHRRPPVLRPLQLVPAVTELVISELLWLNYSAPDKPVYVYINSTGAWTGWAGWAWCCVCSAAGRANWLRLCTRGLLALLQAPKRCCCCQTCCAAICNLPSRCCSHNPRLCPLLHCCRLADDAGRGCWV